MRKLILSAERSQRYALPTQVLYYGKDEALPKQIPLRAGLLSLIDEDGDLRYVNWAIKNWCAASTSPSVTAIGGLCLGMLSQVQMTVQEASFHITYTVENKQGDIDFYWQGEIRGDTRAR